MQKGEALLVRSSLVIYLTLVIMNSINMSGSVQQIGSVGKLIFAFGFIVISVLFIDKSKLKMELIGKNYLIAIGALLMVFGFGYILRYKDSSNLLINLAFPVYFIFYFILLKLFLRINYTKYGALAVEATKREILKLFRITLLVNLVFWFTLAIATGVNMYEVDGNFGGFFQDEIQMGLYSATGFLVSFYLRFTTYKNDKSVFNLVLIFFYVLILVFTSRNSLLIVLIAALYFFVLSHIHNRVYRVGLYLLPVLIVLAIDFFSIEKINEFTSGRWTIWTLATNTIVENKVIFGQGLSNFNDIILRQNKGIGYYYLDTLESLSIHSSFMELIGAGGIISFLLFVKVIKTTWKKLNKIDKTTFLAILSGGLFESLLVMPFMIISILFYVLLFSNNLVITLNKKRIEEISSKTKPELI